MKRVVKPSENTRNNIIEAFWSVFEHKRIENITIKEVMELAGYNRSTFYEYFNDIYEVLDYAENELLIYLSNRYNPTFPIEAIDKELVKAFSTIFKERGKHILILLSTNGSPSFERKIKEAVREKYYKITNKKNTRRSEIILEYFISSIIATFVYWYENKETISPKLFVETMYALLRNGVVYEMRNND